jgi:polyphosphate kinase
MPVLLALHNLARHGNSEKEDVLLEAQELIGHQQQKYGRIFTGKLSRC